MFIPAGFKPVTNATSRRVLRSCVRVYSSALSGTPRLPRHGKTLFCPDRGSPYHRESSAVRPADSSGSCSGIRVSIPNTRRVNIILPPRPGRCQCVVSHCVRTSPAAQRSQPSLFRLQRAPIVIQMLVDLETRTRTVPPLLCSDSLNLPDSDTRHGRSRCLLCCSACTLSTLRSTHRHRPSGSSEGGGQQNPERSLRKNLDLDLEFTTSGTVQLVLHIAIVRKSSIFFSLK